MGHIPRQATSGSMLLCKHGIIMLRSSKVQIYPSLPLLTLNEKPDWNRLVQLMSLLNSLVLARVQYNSRVLFITLPRDLVAILCRNCRTVLDVSKQSHQQLRNSLFSLDIQDLTLGLSLSPVPAYSLTLLRSFLCARVITTLTIILLLFRFLLLL